jgi:hypothetical protein
MPVEIRELQIKVTVNQPGNSAPAAAPAEGGEAKGDNDELVANCIEQVLDIMNNKKER